MIKKIETRECDKFTKRAALMRITRLILLILCVVESLGETVRLNPAADTTLFQTNPNNNLGSVDTLAVGATAAGLLSRALVKFDLAFQIPPEATITSVRLSFAVVKVPTSGGRPSNFLLHRLLQAWAEGNKSGGPLGAAATAGEATWNFRNHQSASWSQPGAAAPDDFMSSASASTSVAGVAQYEFSSTPGLVADVQSWLANPASNFGWIVISQSERTPESARRIATREAGARSPVLTIEYTATTAVPLLRIDLIERVDGQLRLHFLAQPNRIYNVEFLPTLGLTPWSTVTNVGPFAAMTNIVVRDSLADRSRFYRLRTP